MVNVYFITFMHIKVLRQDTIFLKVNSSIFKRKRERERKETRIRALVEVPQPLRNLDVKATSDGKWTYRVQRAWICFLSKRSLWQSLLGTHPDPFLCLSTPSQSFQASPLLFVSLMCSFLCCSFFRLHVGKTYNSLKMEKCQFVIEITCPQVHMYTYSKITYVQFAFYCKSNT